MNDQFIFPPEPDAGWSREVTVLQDAIVWPAGEMRRVQVCGVPHADGSDCPEGAIYRGDTRMMTPVIGRDAPAARLTGRHMWGRQASPISATSWRKPSPGVGPSNTAMRRETCSSASMKT
ncbi:hypothetical protein [Falsirhodobacter deserti]|uniref:hypothetical protein n=1 Tax=Falsirhodobacter deserti TaxID=1365611 RepID=UPI001F4E362D|nr:hypothetical protein [Falsirhodobacter deserti]